MDRGFTKPNATSYTLEDLVRFVLDGRVRIPAFQRGLRWQWEDVRRLFDSIAKGYPIGSLLFWARPGEAEQLTLGGLRIDAPEQSEALWVVDGQQRVTSLANALSPNTTDARFELAYDLRNERVVRPDAQDPAVVPLPVLFDLEKVLHWVSQHPEATDHKDEAFRIAKILREYKVPAYIVHQDDEAVLRDIFDRMNNYGKRLTRAEVFSALHTRVSETGLPPGFADIAEDIDTNSSFGRVDDDTVLRAFLARRGPDITREIRVEFEDGSGGREFPGETREEAYRGASEALRAAVSFLRREAGVPHFTFLPYRFLLVVLTRFFAHHPSPHEQNERLLRRWTWRAAMAGPALAKGSATAAMRFFGSRITPDDETGSVQALLSSFGDEPKFAFPTRFKSTNADTRFVLCALWSQRPRSVVTGEPYDPSQLAETLRGRSTASDATDLLIPKAPDARTKVGNRVILLADETGDQAAQRLAVRPVELSESAWLDVLESHVMTPELAALLDAGDAAAFFEKRSALIEERTRHFLQRTAEIGFEDTPPLDELDLDDVEVRDDAA